MVNIVEKTKQRGETSLISKDEWKQLFDQEQIRVSSKSSYSGTYSATDTSNLSSFATALTPDEYQKKMQEKEQVLSERNAKMDALFEAKVKNSVRTTQENKMVKKNAEVKVSLKENTNSKTGTEQKPKSMSFKAMSLGNAKSADANPASAKSKTLEMGNAKAQSIDLPDSWAKSNVKSMSLDPETLWGQTMIKESNINDAWDGINSAEKKGKELMQVFYHLVKMCETGDLSAIRNFINFIAYINQKDTARMVIEGGKNYIKMQQMIRVQNEKIYGLQMGQDGSSDELLKTMTLVKGETDAIAAAQRQLTQMLESSLQQIEALANVQKGVSDTVGRVLRKLSNISPG